MMQILERGVERMVGQFKTHAIVGYALFSSRVVGIVWEGNRVAIDELQVRGPVTGRIVENQEGGSCSEGQRPKL